MQRALDAYLVTYYTTAPSGPRHERPPPDRAFLDHSANDNLQQNNHKSINQTEVA